MQEQFVTDKNGRKVAVQISLKRYKQLLAESEELDDIKEYRKAKKQESDPIPFDQAFEEIENDSQ